MLKTLTHADGTTRQIHLGGWKKQSPDSRDFKLQVHPGVAAMITPPSYDGRPNCSAIEDQGSLGSCTAHMFAGLVEANEVRAGRKLGLVVSPHALSASSAQVLVTNVTTTSGGVVSYTTQVTPPATPVPTPTPGPSPSRLLKVSRLFQYYGSRDLEGTTSQDAGATCRDAIRTGVQFGIADESVYPYVVANFAVNPPTSVWTGALTHKVTSYHAIADGDLATMKATIASGLLIGFGFQVYDYMMSQQMASSGMLPLPGPSESLQGGHAVCLCGFDDSKQITRSDGSVSVGAVLVRNSWSTAWGLAGYFWMAYDYLQNTSLCSDFWVVASAAV